MAPDYGASSAPEKDPLQHLGLELGGYFQKYVNILA